MSDEGKRKRNPNWHSSEKFLLLSVVEEFIGVLENKRTDDSAMRQKKETWEKAAEKYNASTTMGHRTAANLKAEWELLKKAAKKDLANKRIAANKTVFDLSHEGSEGKQQNEEESHCTMASPTEEKEMEAGLSHQQVQRLMWHNLTLGLIRNQVLAASLCIPCCHLHMRTPLLKPLRMDQRQPKESWLRRLVKRSGWLEHSKSRLRLSGAMLYESAVDQIPYMQFMKELKMEDTFYSWFLITELHVWMLMVRTMAEKEEGRFTRNCMIEAMWEDVTSRAKLISPGDSSIIKEEVHELLQQFQAAMMSYDEGLLTNDKILAGAVWRRIFLKKSNEPEDIECVVQYIRCQIEYLDSLSRTDVLVFPKINWLDFKRDLPT